MRSFVGVVVVLFVACSLSSPEATTPTAITSTFDSLTKNEKNAFMKEKVFPAMAAVFKGHDATRFRRINCKTCHGRGCDEQTYQMPNPDLPRLDFAALHAPDLDPKTKAMVELMEKTVTPDMAKMLGRVAFDPKNPRAGGFGCLTCHVEK